MTPEPEQITDLVALLAWYKAMGVDAAVSDSTVDWLTHGDVAPGAALLTELAGRPGAPTAGHAPRPPAVRVASGSAHRSPSTPSAPHVGSRPLPPTTPLTAEPRTLPVAAPDEAVMAARTAARGATTLAALEASLAGFHGCGLRASAKSTCFYRGSPKARLLIVGEAPGREEDVEGKPFVGKAGQMLDLMLKAIGLTETDVHITNVVYWRPPGNRTPTPQEVLACRPFLDRQIELVAPELLLLLGGAAAKAVLGTEDGIMKIRGKWRSFSSGGHAARVMATLHPAYLLRTPAAKRLAWRDLLAVRSALDAASPN